MISPRHLSKRVVLIALLVLLATLPGCITSNDALLKCRDHSSISHQPVYRLCEVYGHVEPTGAMQSLKFVIGARDMSRGKVLAVCKTGGRES